DRWDQIRERFPCACARFGEERSPVFDDVSHRGGHGPLAFTRLVPVERARERTIAGEDLRDDVAQAHGATGYIVAFAVSGVRTAEFSVLSSCSWSGVRFRVSRFGVQGSLHGSSFAELRTRNPEDRTSNRTPNCEHELRTENSAVRTSVAPSSSGWQQ